MQRRFRMTHRDAMRFVRTLQKLSQGSEELFREILFARRLLGGDFSSVKQLQHRVKRRNEEVRSDSTVKEEERNDIL